MQYLVKPVDLAGEKTERADFRHFATSAGGERHPCVVPLNSLQLHRNQR